MFPNIQDHGIGIINNLVDTYIQATAGENISAGDFIYINSVDSKAYKSAVLTNLIAQSDVTAGVTGKFLYVKQGDLVKINKTFTSPYYYYNNTLVGVVINGKLFIVGGV